MKNNPFELIMYRVIPFILIILVGCTSAKQDHSAATAPADSVDAAAPIESAPPPQLDNVPAEKLAAPNVKNGVIFAKTDFQGVLERTYVKLQFEDLSNGQNKFHLYIGDKEGPQPFMWDVNPVKPGYFFIELPAGTYRISSISIPVGSTQATERMDVMIQVIPEKVTYVGTLQMVGIKEKIRLGGVPVIRPGFDYAANIINEKEEALHTFQQRYPKYSKQIIIKLMELKLHRNEV